jgi:hypothetical protein
MSGKGSGLTKPMKLSAELAAIVGKKEASRYVYWSLFKCWCRVWRNYAILCEVFGIVRFRYFSSLSVTNFLHSLSRAECIKLLWAYLKEHNLQDPSNKQYFTPDAKMAKVTHLVQSLASYISSYTLNWPTEMILSVSRRQIIAIKRRHCSRVKSECVSFTIWYNISF